jgi:UDP-hydrolysing UDP-N-acetyl-D-glucosamine 2-epimerase
VKRVLAVTGGRSDYGILKPVLAAIRETPGLELGVLATGMHCAEGFGGGAETIAADGFPLLETVEMSLDGDSSASVASSMGRGMIGCAAAYGRVAPDMLLVVGDRFEIHAAVAAAAPFRIPVAHVHGGELTFGAIDELFRHSITKLSHLHFASHEGHARRIRQMGEEAWRVVRSGAPGLDLIRQTPLLSREEFCRSAGLDPARPFALVTFHPETMAGDAALAPLHAGLAALAAAGIPALFTASCADEGGRAINAAVAEFVAARPGCAYVESLGSARYFSAMAHAAFLLGNTSSGIVEAATFGLPVVNVGDRQAGRLRPENVRDVPAEPGPLTEALAWAADEKTRERFRGMENPYGDGFASGRIAAAIAAHIGNRSRLVRKRFEDHL